MIMNKGVSKLVDFGSAKIFDREPLPESVL